MDFDHTPTQNDAIKKTSNTKSNLRRLKWGIFEVAYERPEDVYSLAWIEYLSSCRVPGHYALRLLSDLADIAPSALYLHVSCCLWLSFAPALSLYFAHIILGFLQKLIFAPDIDDDERVVLLLFVCMWVVSALLSTTLERIYEDNQLLIGGYLRCHFLPRLAHASLQADMSLIQDYRLQHSFPRSQSFSEGAPGLDIFVELCARATNVLTVFFELLVLFHILSKKAAPDSQIILFLGTICLFVMVVCPTNGIEGAGYTFWTKNPYFYRLTTLHLIIFDPNYRETLAKDGLNKCLYDDYKQTSESLGVVRSDTLALAWNFPRPWYWEMARNLISDYPMTMYSVTLPWKFSSSSLASIALFQYGVIALRHSINQCLARPSSLREIFIRARTLYATMEYTNLLHMGTLEYPHPLTSSRKGMKLSFRDVCVRYKGGDDDRDQLGTSLEAVKGASFDVSPGQLVIITGTNGSGKSSLLRLIPRLTEPSSGAILVDDQSIANYSLLNLRKSIAYVSQNEEIYPVSLRDNILMGLTNPGRTLASSDDKIQEASMLGGADKLVRRLGWDAIINPPSLMGYSIQRAGFGSIGKCAAEELDKNAPSSKSIEISGGERQRLICSRTFMKIKNSDVRLVIMDEPTSALDPIAEHEIFQRILELREGKTVILVSHRLGNLVKHADLVLCLNDGAIVERGTHESLMRVGGQYSSLYKVQCEGL